VDILVVLPFEGKYFWKSMEILNRSNRRFPIDFLARIPKTRSAVIARAIP
jgi:hypothetical protein